MNRKNSRSALFLMELILAILFFAAASAVCVQLFVRAHLISRDTRDLNQAMASAQSAAAALQAEEGDLSACCDLLEGAVVRENGILVLGYDDNWQPVDDGAKPDYLLQITAEESGEAQITVTRQQDAEVLILLPLYCHTPLTLD